MKWSPGLSGRSPGPPQHSFDRHAVPLAAPRGAHMAGIELRRDGPEARESLCAYVFNDRQDVPRPIIGLGLDGLHGLLTACRWWLLICH